MNWVCMRKLARKLKSSGLEPYALGKVLFVHHRDKCQPPCPIHAPSDHPLRKRFLSWRSERQLFERICPHGAGHPDPDDLAYKKKIMHEAAYRAHDFGTHGCCSERCCQ